MSAQVNKARDPRLSPAVLIDRKVVATKVEAVNGWSDKGLGACARTAELRAIHYADAMVPRRDSAAWRRYANEHFAVEFFRLTKPGGMIG
jgi:hypothetical protein